ncbi:protein Atg16l2 isoform X2 [Ambystoma mexicanum]
MKRIHQEKIQGMQKKCGELAYEIIEKQEIVKEKEGILEEQINSMLDMEDQLQTWMNKQFRWRNLVGAQEQVNLELKRGYDELLATQRRKESELREGEDFEQSCLKEILALKNHRAAVQNEINDRIKQKNLQRELERVKKARVAVHLARRTEEPDGAAKSSDEHAAKVDVPKKLQRCHRSSSTLETRPSSFHGFFKVFANKPRSKSISSFSEERYQPLPICVLSRVPSRALCILDTFESEVNAVKFSPNSKLLATGGAGRNIELWDIGGGSMQSLQKFEGSNSTITSVEFDPTGNYILAASYERAAHLWNINCTLPKDSLTGHTGKVTAAKFTSMLHRAVTCSLDRTVKEWDLNRGACLNTISVPSYCSDVVCADYHIISGHHDGKIRFWDSRTKQCVHDIRLHGKITSLNINYNVTQLLSCTRDDELNVIDLRMSRVCLNSKVFRADGFKCGCDWTKAIFSPDGSYVMAGSSDGTLFIWNVNSGKLEKSLNEHHKSSVNAVAWSLSGEFVASADRGKKAILWSEF